MAILEIGVAALGRGGPRSCRRGLVAWVGYRKHVEEITEVVRPDAESGPGLDRSGDRTDRFVIEQRLVARHQDLIRAAEPIVRSVTLADKIGNEHRGQPVLLGETSNHGFDVDITVSSLKGKHTARLEMAHERRHRFASEHVHGN